MPTTMSKKYIKIKGADYTTVDADYDLLHKGSAKTHGRTIKFLYGHDKKEVLGNVVKMWDEDDGLYAIIELADPAKSPKLKQALYELESGLVDKMSIGFRYDDLDYNEEGGYFDVKEFSLYEFSMTPIPSNNETFFLGFVDYKDDDGVEDSSVDNLVQALDSLVTSISNI